MSNSTISIAFPFSHTKTISIGKLVLLHILVGGTIAYLTPISDELKTFLALPMFVTLPFLFGDSITPRRLLAKNTFIQRLLLLWLLGLSSLTIIAMIMDSVGLFNIHLYVGLLIIICAIRVLKDCLSSNTMPSNFALSFSQGSKSLKRALPILVVLLLVTALPAFLLSKTSFPTFIAGDELRFSLGALRILDCSLIPQLGPYFPYLSIMQAISSILFNTPPISLAWGGIFLMYAAFSLGVYFFAFEFSGRRSVSFLAAVFAAYAFYSKTINLTRFVPMTWVYVLFPFFMLCIYKACQRTIKTVTKKDIIVFALVSAISLLVFYYFCSNLLPTSNYSPALRAVFFGFLFLFSFFSMRSVFDRSDSFLVGSLASSLAFLHHDLALIGVGLIYLFILLYQSRQYSPKFFYKVVFLIVLLMIVGSLSFGYLFSIDSYISYFGIDAITKLDILLYSYAIPILVLSVVGAVICFVRRHDSIIPVFFVAVLMLYFLDISISIRAMIFLTIFISYLCAQAVVSIFRWFNA